MTVLICLKAIILSTSWPILVWQYAEIPETLCVHIYIYVCIYIFFAMSIIILFPLTWAGCWWKRCRGQCSSALHQFCGPDASEGRGSAGGRKAALGPHGWCTAAHVSTGKSACCWQSQRNLGRLWRQHFNATSILMKCPPPRIIKGHYLLRHPASTWEERKCTLS